MSIGWIAIDCNIKLIVCSGAPTQEITFNLPPNRVPILEKPVDVDALFHLLREP